MSLWKGHWRGTDELLHNRASDQFPFERLIRSIVNNTQEQRYGGDTDRG
jgi:hypothetical protein